MRRLITVAAVIAGTFWAGAAFADPAAESVVAESAQPGPSNMEAGVYVGGFISNFYHQFYDTSDPAKLHPVVIENGADSGRLRPVVNRQNQDSHAGLAGEWGMRTALGAALRS